MLDTVIVISVDDGLLRTSTGCAGPSGSLTLYTDWLKDTVSPIQWNTQMEICTYIPKLHNRNLQYCDVNKWTTYVCFVYHKYCSTTYVPAHEVLYNTPHE